MCVLIFLAWASGPALAQVQPPDALGAKNVLILHAFEANAPVFQETDRTLGRMLQAGGVPILNQFFQSLELRRYPGPEHRRQLVEQMRARYHHLKFDLIVTMYPEALDFVLDEGRTLFPEAPILALYLPTAQEQPGTAGRVIRHSSQLDMLGTLQIALKLVPGAERVYIVSGAHPNNRQNEERARREFTPWEARLDFRYLTGTPLEETLATLASAPHEAIVLLLPYSNDVRGKSYMAPDLTRQISQASAAPVFGLLEVGLGHGIVGGALFSFESVGTNAGRLALDILRGSPASGNVAPVLNVPAVPMFDWGQLKRWHLSVDALPSGSVVINREYTLWELYRWQAIGAIVLLSVQALLILALLVLRQRRRKAEETLRENEERLRLAMHAASLGVWSWDIPRGRIRLSERVGRMLPETPTAEVTYEEFLAIVHPEDRERLNAVVQQAIQTGKEYELEYRIPQRDGTMRWISSRGSCTYDKEGTPLRMTGVSHDITERKRSELALQESEQRFRKMTDAAHMMVWMSGPDKGCIYFNRSWLNFTGRRMEQEVGDGWTEGVHPEDLDRIARAYSRSFDARAPFDLEYRLRHFDGEYRWIIDVGTPLYEDDGRFCGYLGSCLDITERKRAEGERQLLAAVVESSHDAIFSLGPNLEITSWNPGAERLFGYTAAEVKGQPVWFLVPRESREGTTRVLERVKGGEAIAREDVGCRKDGTRIEVSISSAPIRNATGAIVGVATTIRDVTDRRRAEGEADRLRRELAHMSRVTMMGELTASLAHELNQPLTAIVSNASAGERFLAAPVPPLGEVAEILADVAADAQRAGEVIRRLRSLLKNDTTRFLPLDLNEVIREVVALTQTDALIRHHPIELVLAPALPLVRGDRVQLQQVLLNLVLNGMEAMEAQPPAARRLRIQTLRAGPAVRVAVQDRGPGLPPDKLETVFDAFFTTKAQGMGMGLAISRSILEAHGGRIWAENNPEQGATFWFSLPV
ncbi:MAG TPA: PAS domain S-box protein [Candidatus Methylomirabilis sp.]|nr:PAS domain S-box protein [Candidatus Methylomirabilis sp.]